jgi:hypothetical protein
MAGDGPRAVRPCQTQNAGVTLDIELTTETSDMDSPSARTGQQTGRGGSEAGVEVVHSLASYVGAFGPLPAWDDLPCWPPDVFCVCNLILDHTEAYRFAVAPPAGRRWPPAPDWNARVADAARGWRDAVTVGTPTVVLPDYVQRHWDVLSRARDLPMTRIASGDEWEVCEALLTLHALADEACAGLGVHEPTPEGTALEERAWAMLTARGSLSRLPPRRVSIVPKTNFAARGITIRSMSRYLALYYESVEVRWRRVAAEVRATAQTAGPRTFHVLLVPWPLTVRSEDFRSVPNPLDNMDPEVFGFFEFAPHQTLDRAYLASLVRAAVDQGERVDAVMLPEDAVSPDEIEILEDVLAEHGGTFLVAGVRKPPSEGGFGRNYVHFGIHGDEGWQRYEQDKHHRWCLDGGQIRQYHLCRALDPHKLWWEAIDVPSRSLHVIDVGGGATAAPLVCEDLARMDEVADLLRRIGPSVVLALLLDGPQLVTRWPSRYAGVLADEPGSAVLTLTSFGMVRRSRPPGLPPSRVIALWDDTVHGVNEIALAPGAQAVLLTTTLEPRTVWTADGRRHEGVPTLVLSDVRQVRSMRRAQEGSSRIAASTSSSALSE